MCAVAASHNRVSALTCSLLAAVFLVLAANGRGDYIVLKNGKRLSGLILDESAQLVRLQTDTSIVTLSRDQIDHIERQPRSDNLLFSGRLALRKPNSDLLEAAALLRRSLEAGADPAAVRKAILEVAPYFLDRLAVVSRTEKNEWLALCDRLTSDTAADGAWDCLRGETALAMGDPAAALRAWRSVDALYFAEHDKERDHVLRWALQRLGQGLRDRRFGESVGVLELINRLDPARARSCRVIVTMQEAAAARQRGNVAEACRIYTNELMHLAPEIGKVCLRTTLEPYCNDLCEQGKFTEAIALARSALEPLPELSARLLAKAYGGLIEKHALEGHWEMARGALAEGSQFLDPARLQPLQRKCQYGERRDKLAPNDFAAHYQLGLELQKEGLHGVAIEEFVLAGRSPQLRDMADRQIALIRDDEALGLMERIVGLYGASEYGDVLDLIDQFRQKHPKSEYVEKVDHISRLTHQAMLDEARKAEMLASSRVEHARRLHLTKQTDKALELLDGIIRDHPLSPAAAQARTLKQEIVKQRLTEGVASTPPVETAKRGSLAESLLPDIDPELLDQLDADAFKAEIEQILKQLNL